MSQSLSTFTYKGKHCQCLLFNMKKGDLLKAHRAVVDIMIILKRGVLKIIEDEKETVLLEGDHLLLDANVRHSVTAISDIEFFLFKLSPHAS